MSEHGWPDDHHDDGGGGGFDPHVEDLAPAEDGVVPPEEDFWDHDEPGPDPQPGDQSWEHPAAETHEPQLQPQLQPELQPEHAEAAGTVVGADPDALGDGGDDAADLFPAAVDVGPLPEPVDGFPWIDTGSLGVVDQAMLDAAGTPDPAELAEYAAADLPPGADPWAELAGSDDPAVSALAKFWGSAPGPDQT